MHNPLTDLIDKRCEELSLEKSDLLKALGYRDMNKGHRRLKALAQGEGLNKLVHIRKALCKALEISPAALQESIDATWEQLKQDRDAEYARTFVPHAVLKTSRTMPTQVSILAFTGGPDRWLLVKFERDSDPTTYVSQVLGELPDKVPFFGEVTGFWINYTPLNCVEFDREGKKVRSFSEAAKVGYSKLHI